MYIFHVSVYMYVRLFAIGMFVPPHAPIRIWGFSFVDNKPIPSEQRRNSRNLRGKICLSPKLDSWATPGPSASYQYFLSISLSMKLYIHIVLGGCNDDKKLLNLLSLQ